MEWRARAILGAGPAFVVAACASIAGLEEPVNEPSDDASGGDDGSAGDNAPAEAAADSTPACLAPKKENGADCPAGHGECCSGKCNEKRNCVEDCTGLQKFCDPLGNNDCCFGSWCTPELPPLCAPCIGRGKPVARIENEIIVRACCSNQVDETNGQCL